MLQLALGGVLQVGQVLDRVSLLLGQTVSSHLPPEHGIDFVQVVFPEMGLETFDVEVLLELLQVVLLHETAELLDVLFGTTVQVVDEVLKGVEGGTFLGHLALREVLLYSHALHPLLLRVALDYLLHVEVHRCFHGVQHSQVVLLGTLFVLLDALHALFQSGALVLLADRGLVPHHQGRGGGLEASLP